MGMIVAKPDGFQEAPGKFRVPGTGKSWAHPVVCGGRMYIRYDTTLRCYDVKG